MSCDEKKEPSYLNLEVPQIAEAQIRRIRSNRSAKSYDSAAGVIREIEQRLLDRLSFIRLRPSLILDLGAATGDLSIQLQRQYSDAQVIALDFAERRLQCLNSKSESPIPLDKMPVPCCADALQLPFQEASVDLAIAHLLLPEIGSIDQFFAEVRRVLAPGGVFLFTTVGPDTLRELRESWRRQDSPLPEAGFPDMHDVGDLLLASGFHDPVMETERLTITYPSVRNLLLELKNMGQLSVFSGYKGLLHPRWLAAMEYAYENTYRTEDQRIPASLELVYGLGWVQDSFAPTEKSLDHEYRSEARFSLSRLKKVLLKQRK